MIAIVDACCSIDVTYNYVFERLYAIRTIRRIKLMYGLVHHYSTNIIIR